MLNKHIQQQLREKVQSRSHFGKMLAVINMLKELGMDEDLVQSLMFSLEENHHKSQQYEIALGDLLTNCCADPERAKRRIKTAYNRINIQ